MDEGREVGGEVQSNAAAYQVVKFLGDGTFGRVLECQALDDRRYYAVKVVRSVERYL